MVESQSKFRRSAWAMYFAVIGITAWSLHDPIYPDEQTLHHLPTALFLLALPFLWQRRRLSDASIAQLSLYLLLHVLGAYWCYSNVPYDRWLDDLIGWSPGEHFGFERNHYDRLVHFGYGLLTTLPFAQFLRRALACPRRAALLVSVTVVFAVSSVYEIIEWQVAALADPEQAERYNGQQGDFWDAQKDMALAGVGALIVALPALILSVKKRESGV